MLKNLSWYTLSVDSLNNSQLQFVDAHICTLNNIVMRAESAQSVFRKCRAVDVVHKFCNVTKIPVIFIMLLKEPGFEVWRYSCPTLECLHVSVSGG